MRFDVDWMSRADNCILEHLADEGADTPKEMVDSDRVRFSRQHINARCKTLVEYGPLVHLIDGVYDNTRQGEQYLAGELDACGLKPE